MKILSYLDVRSLNLVGQICQKLNDIVEILHNRAWRSVTSVVMISKNIITEGKDREQLS